MQAPVRDMFVAVSKAIKDQGTDMAKMLARMDSFVSRDTVFKNTYTRQDGLSLEKSKASVEAMQDLEAKVDECQQQMVRMAAVMQHQTIAITDLNFRLEGAQRALQEQEELHVNHAFDDVYQHISAVQGELRAEQSLALQAKQDRAEEGHVPEHIAAALDGLRIELERQARVLESRGASSEAGLIEARRANASLQEQLFRVEKEAETGALRAVSSAREFAKEALLQEARDLGERLAATEQAVSGIRENARDAHEEAHRELDSRIARGVREALSSSTLVSASQVETIMERVLSTKPFGDATIADVRRAVTENNVVLRGDAEKDSALLRREVHLQQQQHMKEWFAQFDTRLQGVTTSFDALRADNELERSRLAEHAADVGRALKRKADQSDVRALVRSRGQRGDDLGFDERTAAASAAQQQKELEDRVSDVVAEVAKLRKASATGEAQVRSELRGKLGAAAVEALLADLVGKATGRPVLEQKASAAGKPWQLQADANSDGSGYGKFSPKYSWKNTLRGGDADVKQALGELGSSLRAELSQKVDRGEVVATVLAEMHGATRAIETLREDVATKADGAAFFKAEHMVQVLHERVVSELTCGLWLWTSRQLVGPRGGDSARQLLPWDTEAVNAAPSSLLWRRGSTEVTVKLPGLYRIGISVFSCLPVTITVILNGEPILELGPDSRQDRLSSFANAQGSREERYLMRRLRHSEGDVTGVSLDEPLSLPANAVISVGYQSVAVSQAFLSLRKL